MRFKDRSKDRKSFRRILISYIRPISIALLLLLLPLSADLNASSNLNNGQEADNSTNISSIENPSLWLIFEILKSKDMWT